MKQLLNMLYVTMPDSYLSLDGENVVVLREEAEAARVPLHNLSGIVCFGYTGASPALMAACAQRDVSICFFTQNNRFLARVVGKAQGNVILRKTQYRLSDDESRSLPYARNFISAKLFNSRWVIERAVRDHALRLDADKLKGVSQKIHERIGDAQVALDLAQLRGVEGEAAKLYFSVFDDMVLQQKEDFLFEGRNRHPPLDRINALLSFAYSLMTNEIASALTGVGLDPYVGFLHRDRPGRTSLALDMLEELRSVFVDRFVISLINLKQVKASGFKRGENGAVIMDEDTRKTVLAAWQSRKQEEILHPYLQEKLSWGMVPHAQSLLLSRAIRDDLDAYPPFLWK